jgi:hypothetical protein
MCWFISQCEMCSKYVRKCCVAATTFVVRCCQVTDVSFFSQPIHAAVLKRLPPKCSSAAAVEQAAAVEAGVAAAAAAGGCLALAMWLMLALLRRQASSR